MRQITRKEAQTQGLKNYYTGKPCKHGHYSSRDTKSRICCECRKEYHKNPKAKAKVKEYQNRPDVKAKKKEYQNMYMKEYQKRPDVKAKKKERRQQLIELKKTQEEE